MAWIILVLSTLLSGCVLIDKDGIKELIESLAGDPASACVTLNWMGRGLVACRSNQPGSVIAAKDLKIFHGVYRIPVDQKELEELKELRSWIREHGIIVVPATPPSMNGVEANEASRDLG